MAHKNIELLAPVGSKESLYAAVQNGADAVYLGGEFFSARQYANNFDNKELAEAVIYSHLRNVKVYVAVNILIDDSEMSEALEYIRFLYNSDVDALIIQDIGLAFNIKKYFPDFEIHGSTQMTINNLEGALFLEKIGFKRVVLARETPLEEIKRIRESSSIELEGFIHGALCVCYSGQCLMSSLIGGRSGNRGNCAQPCRRGYYIIDKNGNKIANKKYYLSTKDLNLLDNIDYLIENGITSLKIEGRMKRPEYVATVVSKYRKALDNEQEIENSDKNDLEDIFNRGFTKGLGYHEYGNDFLSTDIPKNRGLKVGKVNNQKGNNLIVKLYENIRDGDILKIKRKDGKDYIYKVENDISSGDNKTIDNIYKDIDISSDIYRTSNKYLLDKANNSFVYENIKYPLKLKLFLKEGNKAIIKGVIDEKEYSAETDFIIETAKKIGLTEEKIYNQISKLGDTVYYIEDISIEIVGNIFMPISEINKLRRNLIDEIDKDRSMRNRRSIIKNSVFKEIEKEKTINKKSKLSIYIKEKSFLNRLNLDKLDRIYLGFTEGLEESLNILKEKDIEVYLSLPRILYSKEMEEYRQILHTYKDKLYGVEITNISQLKLMEEFYNLKIHSGSGLNHFNSYSGKFLYNKNVNSFALSHELTLAQINTISKNYSKSYEVLGYGYIPVMVNESCPASVIKACKDRSNCKTCKFKKGFSLLDEKNIAFRFENRENTTIIYNSYPVVALDFLDRFLNTGIEHIRLDFNFEDESIEDIQSLYFEYMRDVIGKKEVLSFLENFKKNNTITKGHYYRGVIQ